MESRTECSHNDTYDDRTSCDTELDRHAHSWNCEWNATEYKSYYDAEFEAAKTAVSVLGAKEKAAHSLWLPCVNGEKQERRIFVFEKVKPTPQKYPRPTAKIKKEALR